MPGQKHTAADGLSRKPPRESDLVPEEDIDDYIDAVLNPVQVMPLSTETVSGELVLEDDYSEGSQLIAKYLMTLHQPDHFSTKQF